MSFDNTGMRWGVKIMKQVMMLFGILMFLSACNDAEAFESEISELEEEIQGVTSNLSSLEEEKEQLVEEINTLTEEKNEIAAEYDDYKERMQPYEELEESEAEARKIEADRIAAEEKEMEEKQKAEEEAAEIAAQEAAEKEEEERVAQGYETGITYDQLARNPDEYIGEMIKFSGKVIQVIEGTDENQLRFAVNDDYDKVMYLGYSPDIVDQRVLEDDHVTIYGISIGTISYESTGSGPITIPASVVDRIDFN